MNKVTAQQLLLAVAKTESALKQIRRRQGKVSDKEYEANPGAFDDFRYFGDRLEEALDSVTHWIDDAKAAVRKQK